MKSKYRTHVWVREVRPEKGYTMRFFLAAPESGGGWSACDNGGSNPDYTDDGPLWICRDLPISKDRETERFYIRAIRQYTGERVTVGIGEIDATWLQRELGMECHPATHPPIPYYDSAACPT